MADSDRSQIKDSLLPLPVSEALHAAIYTAVQQPMEGARELLNHALGFKCLPNLEIVEPLRKCTAGTAESSAQYIGGLVGSCVPMFLLSRRLGGPFSGKVKSLATEVPSIKSTMMTGALKGAIIGGVLTPVGNDSKDFWRDRLKNTLSHGVNFAVMDGAGLWLRGKHFTGMAPSYQHIAREIYYGSASGGVAGFVGAHTDSILSGKGLASTSDALNHTLGSAVTGGALGGIHGWMTRRAAVKSVDTNIVEGKTEKVVTPEKVETKADVSEVQPSLAKTDRVVTPEKVETKADVSEVQPSLVEISKRQPSKQITPDELAKFERQILSLERSIPNYRKRLPALEQQFTKLQEASSPEAGSAEVLKKVRPIIEKYKAELSLFDQLVELREALEAGKSLPIKERIALLKTTIPMANRAMHFKAGSKELSGQTNSVNSLMDGHLKDVGKWLREARKDRSLPGATETVFNSVESFSREAHIALLKGRYGWKGKEAGQSIKEDVQDTGMMVQNWASNQLSRILNSNFENNAHVRDALTSASMPAERAKDWVGIPTIKNSNADSVGCDYLLANTKTGEYYPIDFTVQGIKQLSEEQLFGAGRKWSFKSKAVPIDRMPWVILVKPDARVKPEPSYDQLSKAIANIIAYKSPLNLLDARLPSNIGQMPAALRSYELTRFSKDLTSMGMTDWAKVPEKILGSLTKKNSTNRSK